MDEFFTRLTASQWLVFAVSFLLLTALAELGFRIGLFYRVWTAGATDGHSASVHGAVLGLLGLLLGFSFSMAVSRHDTRRFLAVDEANAIGTAWLRASFLGKEAGKEARILLRRYAGLRVTAHDAASGGASLQSFVRESNSIQNALWTLAEQAAAEKPDPVTASFITALNQTIDLQASRLAAHRNHVPGAVWLLVLTVAGCGAWASGYLCGSAGYRSKFNQVVFPLLIAVVLTLISDIDRPARGFVGVSQQPMLDLLESMPPEEK